MFLPQSWINMHLQRENGLGGITNPTYIKNSVKLLWKDQDAKIRLTKLKSQLILEILNNLLFNS